MNFSQHCSEQGGSGDVSGNDTGGCGEDCTGDDGMDEIFNITACRHRLTDPQCRRWWRPFANGYDGNYNHTACLFCKDFEPMDIEEILK